MVDEPRQFPHSVHRLASQAVGPRDGSRAAAEHADFAHLKIQRWLFWLYIKIMSCETYVAVFSLDESKKGWHIWTPKVVTGL